MKKHNNRICGACKVVFRKRTKFSEKMKAARKAKERKRLEGDAPDYPVMLPEIRRRIIVIDYDFGEVKHEIVLRKTNRVDCYQAVVDGNVWKERIGWAKVLEGVRKSFVRVGANV